MDELRKRLVADAFLYDDPLSYIAGIDAALAVAETSTGDPVEVAVSDLSVQERTSA